MRKIAFFDVDGTLTSEIDGSIPASTVDAIRAARANGNLMFINTGRCFHNLEERFQSIGFDGFVCGCGTDIYCDGRQLMHITQSHETTMQLLKKAKEVDMDIVFESCDSTIFDISRPIHDPDALKLQEENLEKGFEVFDPWTAPNFRCDKFVTWIRDEAQLNEFRKVSDQFFECIDRGGLFREFVPIGYTKATGLQYILDHYGLTKEDAYVFGDSNNDLPMLTYVPNSVAMGNAEPESLKEKVAYVTKKSSEGGIAAALKHFGFI